MKNAVETEIKLPLPSAVKGRRLLRDAAFTVQVKRVFELNLVLDDQAGTLRNSQRLLRVRHAAKVVTCTFKGPEMGGGNHKRREEREFEASNLEETLRLFNGLGYSEKFRYEKYRTEFTREGQTGTATVDETPIGCYMELEGPARWIDRTAKELGFTTADYITLSYGKLYFNWCAARGIPPGNFVFPD